MTEASTLPLIFTSEEGQCWRMLRTHVGHAAHCRARVVWRARYRDPTGHGWTVWSCAEHLAGLDDVRPCVTPSP